MQTADMLDENQTFAYALHNISVSLTAVFGRSTLQMKDLMALKTGDRLPLGDHRYPEVEILLNGKLFGWGEIAEIGGHPSVVLKSFVWNR
jgi:flagellar motor switch/type III secretory pathway protein FliN